MLRNVKFFCGLKPNPGVRYGQYAIVSTEGVLPVGRVLDHRREPPALVVAITILQLMLVVLVWLLALAPAALAALTILLVKAARGAFRASDVKDSIRS